MHEDAIVNAANDKLERGGGVCGSIFRAAGPYLDAACAALNGCATGDAVLTESFNIQHVKAIVHAVGPRVVGSLNDRHRRDLASCYARSLDVAVQHGLNSIVGLFSLKIYCFDYRHFRASPRHYLDFPTRKPLVLHWMRSSCGCIATTMLRRFLWLVTLYTYLVALANCVLHVSGRGPRHLQKSPARLLSRLCR